MKEILKFPKGSIIVFTEGCYSDYGMCGYLVSMADLDLIELAAQFRKEFVADKETPWRDVAEPSDFPSWLVSQGLAMPVDYSIVHMGSYGDWSSELRGEG